jgi:eukaryotic-like serine/threonine-protein kinase
LRTHERRVLISGGAQAHYLSTGYLAYFRAGTLMAVPFDPAHFEVKGDPTPVVEGVMSNNNAAQFAISDEGSLAYLPTGPTETQLNKLVWVDRKGVSQPLSGPSGGYRFPRLSPDATRIALQIGTTKTDIWVYDVTRETLTPLTSDGISNWPIWTPDGKRVTFTSNRGGHQNIFWKFADGSGSEERLTTSEHVQTPRSWSSDGQMLVFSDTDPNTGEDIWLLTMQGGRNPRPLIRTKFDEGWARLSPDNRWLAYVSKESVRPEVYLRQFPEPGGRWQISPEGGTEPVWAHNGRELFYRSGDKMMAVDLTTQPTLRVGKPHQLFESAEYTRVSTTPNYDVSPDDKRFLMIKSSEQQNASTQIIVVLNWFEDLEQKVPTGKK